MKKINVFIKVIILFVLILNIYPVFAEEGQALNLLSLTGAERELLVKYTEQAWNTGDIAIDLRDGNITRQNNSYYIQDLVPQFQLVSYRFASFDQLKIAAHMMAEDPRVEVIAPNHRRDAHVVTGSQQHETDVKWHLEQYKLSAVWERIPLEAREKIKVAVLDSGVDLDHPDLQAALLPGHNAIQEGKLPWDDSQTGHGTHVAGIIGAQGKDVVGVATGTKIMPIKILDQHLKGDVLTEIKGIVWAVENGAHIINLSLGGPRYINGKDAFNQIEYAAIQYAVANGVTVVSSAGNTGGEVGYPAAYQNVIAVGSVNREGEVSWFSSDGQEVRVAAPGEDIYSTLPKGQYGSMTGTSMAAPFVSGVAGLLQAHNNDLCPYEIKQLLMASADSQGQISKKGSHSYGLINPLGSIQLPLIQVLSNNKNVFHPGYQLEFTFQFRSPKGQVAEAVYEAVYLETYRYNVDFERSYGGYFYGTYQLLHMDLTDGSNQVYSFTEPGFYELRIPYHPHVYGGNRYQFGLFPEAPKASLASGYYYLPVTVELTSSTVSGQVYYATDGLSPLSGGQLTGQARLYTQPLTIYDDQIIKTITVEGDFASSIATYWYRQHEIIVPKSELEKEMFKPCIIETQWYTLEVSSWGSGTTYWLQLKSNLSQREKPLEIPLMALQEAIRSGNHTLIIDEETLIRLTGLKKGVIVSWPGGEVHLAREQLLYLRELGADLLELKLFLLLKETAQQNLPILQQDRDNVQLKLLAPIIRLQLLGYRDWEHLSAEELKPVKGEMIFALPPVDFKERLIDYPTVGLYQLKSNGLLYLGGKLSLDLTKVSWTLPLENQILLLLEYSHNYEDLPGHWARKEAEVLTARQLLMEVEESRFSPDDKILWEEFVSVLVAEWQRDAEDSLSLDFLELAGELGLTKGLEVNPNRPISRAEAAVLIWQALHAYEKKGVEFGHWGHLPVFWAERKAHSDFQQPLDFDQLNDLTQETIIKLWQTGLLRGYPDGTFRPQQELTRAEAAVLLVNLFIWMSNENAK